MSEQNEAEADVPDDISEFDQLWEASGDDVTGDDAEVSQPVAEPEPEPESKPEPASEGDTGEEDVGALKQKLASAEGRYRVFSDSLDEMRTKLTNLESRQSVEEPKPEAEPEPEPAALPSGWTQEDWDDYRSDNPVGAELFENQTREVEQLREQVNQTVQEHQLDKAQKEFNAKVMVSHPDYLELLESKREDIRAFIDSEKNPLLKQAYDGVYQQGAPEQVADLVTAYKSSRRGHSQETVQQRRVQDALAVTSHSSSPDTGRKSGMPDENDFDAAWDYFADDSID